MDEILTRAARFASALDAEDYAVAAACLGSDCVYLIGGQTRVGPAAIVASYREAGDWAGRTLDRVRYESSVRAAGSTTAIVTFVDHIEHEGEALAHRCEQVLEFDASGRIRRIEHRDLPGEQEAIEALFDRVGIRRGPGD